jgi:hypothetical protein
MLLPLYTGGNSRWYPLDRRLGGPQCRSGHCGEEKILHYRDRTRAVQPHSLSLYRLRYSDSYVCICVCVYCTAGCILSRAQGTKLANSNIPCLCVSRSLVSDKQFCNLHIKLSATTELSPKEQYALHYSAMGNLLRLSLDRFRKNVSLYRKNECNG